MTHAAASIESSSGPDWSTITETIRCPLCEYDLRGLTDPRCPECGRTFDWPKLIDPTQRLHPYLFEHHPKRNAWSFRRTLIGGLRPIRFWRALQPQMPSSPRRLIVYWMICLCVAAMFYIAPLLNVAQQFALANQSFRSYYTTSFARMNPAEQQRNITPHQTVRAYLNSIAPMPDSLTFWRQLLSLYGPERPFNRIAAFLLLWTIWPWLSLAAFQTVRISMRTKGVGWVHVMRVMLYAFDAVAWPGIVCASLFAANWIVRLWNIALIDANQILNTADYVCYAIIILAAVRLWAACRYYLRLPHALGIVIATQLITALALVVISFRFTLSTVIVVEYVRETWQYFRS